MTGGALGNTWLAGNVTVAATVEMWRAWLFGPLPTPEPDDTPEYGSWNRVPLFTAGVPAPDESDDLFFALI